MTPMQSSEQLTTPPENYERCLLVEAYVEATAARPEAMQALVSQWRPPDHWSGFAAFDAGATDGLASRGYFGAVFDGRYVYFVPEQHGEAGTPTHAVVLRYDTHADFDDASAYAAYDASCTDGLETRGFYGAAFDGRYVYFVPRQIDVHEYHSRLLRLDTRGDFKNPSSWAAFDIGEAHSSQSAAFDGRYLYLCPGFHGDPRKEDEYSSRVIRYDTRADFKSRSSYAGVDITRFLDVSCACFDGGAFDGRYIYFVPLYTGVVVRYDTRGRLDDPMSWQKYDTKRHGGGMNVGAVFDGRYLYLCAYAHGTIVRFDTQRDFLDAASWQAYDARMTEGLRTEGFDGGFFDGRFVYFQPFFFHAGPDNKQSKLHSHYLRYDASKPFDDAGSWQAFDASHTDGLRSIGYNAGAFDGRYFYAAPWQQGPKPDAPGQFITHGIVLRCDTLGAEGSFSLRYCDYGHNGGLNAAVFGPSFIVNTDRGALFVAGHRPLQPGKHHLAGTYDGKAIKLYVDGELVAQRAGSGRIVNGDRPVVLGRIEDGVGHFEGRILHAEVRTEPRTDREVKALAAARMHEDAQSASLRVELDTYLLLDGRKELLGQVNWPVASQWVPLRATHLASGQAVWQTTIDCAGDAGPRSFIIPVADVPPGYCRMEAMSDRGDREEVTFASRHEKGKAARRDREPLAFTVEAVEKILEHHAVRLGGQPFKPVFVVTPEYSALGYRSLGRKENGRYVTCWFPERPFEFRPTRADHEMWPVLDQLSALTGEPRHRDRVTAMLEAIGEHGFDPASGLMYLSEECDFDVLGLRPRSKANHSSDLPRFKPLNTGNHPQLHLARMWPIMPRQLRRCFRAMFIGLTTDPQRMDYNRFCFYGFDDRSDQPQLTKNPSWCAFDTAGARMIHWWCSCYAHTGDRDCLDWAQRMAAKWRAVMHPVSGLVPNFFGAASHAPGEDQQPGQWAETRGAAMTAAAWAQAAQELQDHREAAEFAQQLMDMAARLALGVARFAYDGERRIFREHLSLDGNPWAGTARYCFATQQEKDEAVKQDPVMAQVPVYSGTGLFRDPNYYSHCAGSDIPWHLAVAAAASSAAGSRSALPDHLAQIAADALDESRKIDGAFTPEGRWTFTATGTYIKLHLLLHRLVGESRHLDAARELAQREMAALDEVVCPDWWRMRERAVLLDALLELAQAADEGHRSRPSCRFEAHHEVHEGHDA